MKKQFQCQRCDTIFTKESLEKFIKTIMPKCPMCGSTDVKIIASKKEK